MDKSWIDLPNRMSREYMDGIDRFLSFAYTNRVEGSTITCPCRICENRYYLSQADVREHLQSNGFLKKYKNWTNHGEYYVPLHGNHEDDTLEDSNIQDDMVRMIHEARRIPNVGTSVENDETNAKDPRSGPNEETANYLKLLEDAQTELYPRCREFMALSFIIGLLHMKVLNGWTDKSLTDLLKLLNMAFPEGVKLPSSYYEAQKMTEDLGFKYETWDACPNNYHHVVPT